MCSVTDDMKFINAIYENFKMKQTYLIITALMLIVGCSNINAQQFITNVEETYKNGSPKVVKIYIESNENIKLVKENHWYLNGQKKLEGNYVGGLREGAWTEWYLTGQKRGVGTWNGDKREGIWTFWDWDGQKEEEQAYKNDKREGKWIAW